MKRFRLSGSVVFDTCSAETTVPWMTRRSSSAFKMAGASETVRCGVTEAAATTPASLIWRMRSVTSSSLIGSMYICCIRAVALSSSSSRISSKMRLGVLVAGPEPFEVEHADATQATELDGRGRAGHPVHGGAEERQLEAEGVDLPGDVDVLGVAGAPAGHDGDVIEPVGLSSRLEDADLDLSHSYPPARAPLDPVRRRAVLSAAPEPTLDVRRSSHLTVSVRLAGVGRRSAGQTSRPRPT